MAAFSVGTYFWGRWSARPKLAIQPVDVSHEVADEIKVWLPLESDLQVLSHEVATYYAWHRPDLFQAFRSCAPTPFPPIDAATGLPIGQPTPAPPPAANDKQSDEGTDPPPPAYSDLTTTALDVIQVPPTFMRFSIAELYDLFELSDLPPGVVAYLEEQAKNYKAADSRHADELTSTVNLYSDRLKKLPAAKARIEALEKEWLQDYGVFKVEVVITNSGERGISLNTPIWLYFSEKDVGKGRLQMYFQNEQSVMISPNESKRIRLISRRADDAENDDSRILIQRRFIETADGTAHLGLTNSEGGQELSTTIKFVPRMDRYNLPAIDKSSFILVRE